MRKGISARSLRRRLMIATAAASVMALVMSGAQAQIAGSVTGAVTITSPAAGITTTCAPTVYSFAGVEIVGTLTSGTTVFSGNVSVANVAGSSSGPHPLGQCAPGNENSEGASGNVNTAASPATLSGVSTPPSNTITGRFWGEPADGSCGGPCGYVRRGTVVTVKLHVQYCFNIAFAACFPLGNPIASAVNTVVSVNAQFTPNPISGINTSTGGVTGAVFQGSFNN